MSRYLRDDVASVDNIHVRLSSEVVGIAGGDRLARITLRSGEHPFETSVPGVFAAGDVRTGSVKRVASAVGEGSVVIQREHAYLDATVALRRPRP